MLIKLASHSKAISRSRERKFDMMDGRKRKFSHDLDGSLKDEEEKRDPSRPVDLVYRTTEILA